MGTVRNGAEEMRLADEILARELPGAPTVTSPGRALLVNTLFDRGFRGSALD